MLCTAPVIELKFVEQLIINTRQAVHNLKVTRVESMLTELESLKAILPLLGSFVGVLLTGAIGVATYAWQENIKRQTELVQRRQKLYEDLNGALFGLI
jgi:integral membrane sensor domain MASE1